MSRKETTPSRQQQQKNQKLRRMTVKDKLDTTAKPESPLFIPMLLNHYLQGLSNVTIRDKQNTKNRRRIHVLHQHLKESFDQGKKWRIHRHCRFRLQQMVQYILVEFRGVLFRKAPSSNEMRGKNQDSLTEQVLPKVINLSSRSLTEHEINLLKKGLKFCPTPKSDKKELECDVLRFCRQLRLEEKYFSDNYDQSTENVPLVRNKSTHNPPKCDDIVLEETISRLKKHPLPIQNRKSNLSYQLRKAQENLAQDKTIIIKEVDKGGAVVVMDTDYYAKKIREMLSNEEFYNECNSEQDEMTFEQIVNLVNREGGELLNEEIDYLTNFSFKTSYFYGLPKIHKSSQIANAIK